MISKKASDRGLDAFFEFGNVVIAVQKKHLLSVHLNFLATFFLFKICCKNIAFKNCKRNDKVPKWQIIVANASVIFVF